MKLLTLINWCGGTNFFIRQRNILKFAVFFNLKSNLSTQLKNFDVPQTEQLVAYHKVRILDQFYFLVFVDDLTGDFFVSSIFRCIRMI